MLAEDYVEAGSLISSSNKAVRPTPSILGWVQGLTNRSHRPRSNRPLARMCWRPSRRRLDYQRKNSWPGFPGSCLTQSINTRPKAICRRLPSIDIQTGIEPGNPTALWNKAPATTSPKRKNPAPASGVFLGFNDAAKTLIAPIKASNKGWSHHMNRHQFRQ